MAAINFSDLKSHSAEHVLEGFANVNDDAHYLTYGRILAWANDSSPPQANTMPATFNEIWFNAVAMKRLTSNDARYAIPRNPWTANTVYTQYDSLNPNLFLSNTKFYVINSQYSVYKCLYNSLSANSTVEPTAVNPSNITQTSDGYIWKYLYTLTSDEQLRFTNDNYIPVKTLSVNDGSQQWLVQQNAIDGAIYNMVITNPGANYTNVSNLIITITGDGLDAVANATINNVSNTVNSISMTNYGLGYHYADVVISGGGGSGATARAIMSPQGGHGSDPRFELGNAGIIMNLRLNNSEGGLLSTNNQIRQVAIIMNPEDTTGNIAANSVYTMSYDLTVVGSGTDYVIDEPVFQGGSIATSTFSGNVLEYNSANSLLRVVNVKGTPTGKTLVGANSTASKFVTSITTPVIRPYTGRLLYVDNIKPITRNASQIESFQIVFTF